MYISPAKNAERVSRQILNVKIYIWRLFCGTWYLFVPPFQLIEAI